MQMTTRFRQQLKAKAHHLKPVITIGASGLTENIKKDVEQLLADHELIKIRINETDRTVRETLFTEVCQSALAEPIQLLGGVGTVYRKKQEE